LDDAPKSDADCTGKQLKTTLKKVAHAQAFLCEKGLEFII
jgi:hypothetical protein